MGAVADSGLGQKGLADSGEAGDEFGFLFGHFGGWVWGCADLRGVCIVVLCAYEKVDLTEIS